MNTPKGRNNRRNPVVMEFKNYVRSKARLKKRCLGCSYRFKPKNNHDCFCDQCSDGRKVYRNLKAVQAMLAVGGVYGYH